jgi:ribA/ribD-fused uncharacterized protein
MSEIAGFKGEYRFLSNFYEYPGHPVIYEGIAYPTAEHAYQAQKYPRAQRPRIAMLPTPGAAKKMGRLALLPKNWEDTKYDIMYRVVKAKFGGSFELAELLRKTDSLRLVETNEWGDCYWGVCGGIGFNKLGEILMRVRSELP